MSPFLLLCFDNLTVLLCLLHPLLLESTLLPHEFPLGQIKDLHQPLLWLFDFFLLDHWVFLLILALIELLRALFMLRVWAILLTAINTIVLTVFLVFNFEAYFCFHYY